MTARHHHFLSQCYLRGFTKNGSKKSNLIVVELSQKKHFETKPRNVGGIRDFNRINAEGVDQNILEKSLADFESQAATSLKALVEGADFAGQEKEAIITLIGLSAVRSPQMRENMREFQAQIAERILDIALASKERWESQIGQMRESGENVSESVTYEDVKRFHDSKAYKIDVAREHHIRMEMEMLQTIVPLLMERNWTLIRSNAESGSFITADRPVALDYDEPEKIPPVYRNAPGFGLTNTYVYFPIAKHVSLLGQFSERPPTLNAARGVVAHLNTRMLHSAYRQVYTPSLDFPFVGRDGEIMLGKALLAK